MTFRRQLTSVTALERSRIRYYDKIFSKEHISRPPPKLREPSLYLCCSDSQDDRVYTKEIYMGLKRQSRSVDVFYDDVDVHWGEKKVPTKTEALKRSSHAVLVVTRTLFCQSSDKSSEALAFADTMFRLARENKIQLLPLLAGVKEKDFSAAFPLYANLKPLLLKGSQDASEAADKILNFMTKSSFVSRERFLTNRHLFHTESEKRAWAGLGNLPPKVADLKGREKELKKILSEFCPGTPYCWISGQPGIGKSSLAIYIAHEMKKGKSNVVYIDAQSLDSETDIFSEILRNIRPCIPAGDRVETVKFTDPVVSEVTSLLNQADSPCIILDGCDRALAGDEKKQVFLNFLWKIHGPMILITSCLRAQLLPVRVIDIPLDPLGNDDAENLLKSCLPPEHQSLLKRSTIVRVQQLCQGVPMLIRLAGAVLCNFRGALSQDEIVKKLQAKPLKMFKTVNPSATAFIAAIYDLVPSSLKVSLHGVALFIGSFTRLEGARVFGFKEGLQFGIEVVGPLQEYSLLFCSANDEVTGNNTQYYVHGLIREFLRQQEFKTREFREIQERYCIMQLDKIAKVQSMYDSNPRDAILRCRMHGFSRILDELAGTLRKLGETSLKVLERLLLIARHPNSWMNHCFDKETRKKFLKVCLGVAVDRKLTVVEMNIRLLLSDVLLQLNQREIAASGFEKVRGKLSSASGRQREDLDVRYCLIEAKFHIAESKGQQAVDSLMKISIRARERQDFCVALGNAYKCSRDYNEAIGWYRAALERCNANFGTSQSLGFHPDNSHLLMNIGHCQFCSAKFSDSYESFSKALLIQRYLRSDGLWLAMTYYHLGICQASRGKQSEALDQFKEVYDLLEDTKDDQSVVYLLTRQAHAKLLFTEGIELWKISKSEDKYQRLRKAASYLQNLLKRLQDYSEMRLILAESRALLVVIHFLLSDKEQAFNHKDWLGQLDFDQELVSRCSVLSCVKKADIEDDSEQSGVISAALERRMSVTFHCYVGGQLMAASEETSGRERSSSDASRIFELETNTESQSSPPQSPPIQDYWSEFDDVGPATASTELSITGEPTHLGSTDSYAPPAMDEISSQQVQPNDMGGSFSPAMYRANGPWSTKGNLS